MSSDCQLQGSEPPRSHSGLTSDLPMSMRGDDDLLELETIHAATLPPHVKALCPFWRRVYWEKRGIGGSDWTHYHALANNCELCSVLIQASREALQLPEGSSLEVHVHDPRVTPSEWFVASRSELGYKRALISCAPGESIKSIEVSVACRDHGVLETICPLGIFPAHLVDSHPVPRCVCTQDIFGKVKAIMNHCKASHPICRLEILPWLPTRVIEISGEPAHARLLSGAGVRGQYLCLSHCWGTSQPLTTTTNKLSRHLVDIPWDELPRLFQQFFELARALQVRYAWIDSLCIIQDDQDDWVRESARMCDVYENSFVTVCATVAPDSRAGLWDRSGNTHHVSHDSTPSGLMVQWLFL